MFSPNLLQPIPFEEWIKLHPEISTAQKTIECPDCEGVGEWECSECGSEIVCEVCEGEGTIIEHDARKAYEAELAYESQLIAEYERLGTFPVISADPRSLRYAIRKIALEAFA